MSEFCEFFLFLNFKYSFRKKSFFRNLTDRIRSIFQLERADVEVGVELELGLGLGLGWFDWGWDSVRLAVVGVGAGAEVGVRIAVGFRLD